MRLHLEKNTKSQFYIKKANVAYCSTTLAFFILAR
jgi:hypothetical protein